MTQDKQHKNDMYGNIDARSESDEGVLPPIPAATVVLLRDSEESYEVLMLKKNSKITFGGMWVFPGGKIDPEDYGEESDLEYAARAAAVRETKEETGISLDSKDFIHFSHWTPPPGPQKRFATWFFIAKSAGVKSVEIDEGEIKDHQWIKPSEALAKHSAGDIDLVPPTWITLHHLSLYEKLDDVLAENNAEDAAAIASQQKMLPPAPPEAERGTFIAHGKELLGNNRIIDGPDTGYLAQAEQGATSVTPINNFFTRGQTGAASKTGGMPSGKPVIGRKISSIGNIPEVKKETEKLAKAAVLPVQASGAMTLGILGQSMGEMGGLAGEKGVETGIKKMAAPIAGMFGVKNSIANNVAGEVGSAADAAKRSASTAAGDAIKEGPFQGVFNALGDTVNWVKSLFTNKNDAEKGGVVKTSSGNLTTSIVGKMISAEKGAIIDGPKTGYPINIGGTPVNAHGKEHVKKVDQGVKITPLDNFATDGIQGNEVTPGGDLNVNSKTSFERGGTLNQTNVRRDREQAAMSSPPSRKTDIVQLNSKEREFNRMLTKVQKVDPIVINSANSKTDPPPQEIAHIANKGDCDLDVIYPPLI